MQLLSSNREKASSQLGAQASKPRQTNTNSHAFYRNTTIFRLSSSQLFQAKVRMQGRVLRDSRRVKRQGTYKSVGPSLVVPLSQPMRPSNSFLSPRPAILTPLELLVPFLNLFAHPLRLMASTPTSSSTY